MVARLPFVRLRPRADTFYVSQGRTVFETDAEGWIPEGGAHGLFVYQTRLLSQYRWLVDGAVPRDGGALQRRAALFARLLHLPARDGGRRRRLLGRRRQRAHRRAARVALRRRWRSRGRRRHQLQRLAGVAALDARGRRRLRRSRGVVRRVGASPREARPPVERDSGGGSLDPGVRVPSGARLRSPGQPGCCAHRSRSRPRDPSSGLAASLERRSDRLHDRARAAGDLAHLHRPGGANRGSSAGACVRLPLVRLDRHSARSPARGVSQPIDQPRDRVLERSERGRRTVDRHREAGPRIAAAHRSGPLGPGLDHGRRAAHVCRAIRARHPDGVMAGCSGRSRDDDRQPARAGRLSG